LIQDVLVLGVRAYDFMNQRGENQKGMKVIYLDSKEDSLLTKGYIPLQAPSEFTLLDKFSVFPAMYTLDFRQRADSKTGKPMLVVTDAQYLANVDLGLVT